MGALGMRGVSGTTASDLAFRRDCRQTLAPPKTSLHELQRPTVAGLGPRADRAASCDYLCNSRHSSGLFDKNLIFCAVIAHAPLP